VPRQLPKSTRNGNTAQYRPPAAQLSTGAVQSTTRNNDNRTTNETAPHNTPKYDRPRRQTEHVQIGKCPTRQPVINIAVTKVLEYKFYYVRVGLVIDSTTIHKES